MYHEHRVATALRARRSVFGLVPVLYDYTVKPGAISFLMEYT